jgi:hypothetical protein
MISALIVILLTLLFASSPKQFAPFSHTSLGRLLAVIIIIYFAKMNTMSGIVACFVVILYYQMEEFEHMLNIPEGFLWEMTYTPYSNEVYEELHSKISENFRQDNCTRGKLMFKGAQVNPEMAQHVFPSIKFNGAPCDPCNARCNFSILQKKLSTETNLRGLSSKQLEPHNF